MNNKVSMAWIVAAACWLASCGGGNTPALMPVQTSEIAPDDLGYPDPNMFFQGVEIPPLVPSVRGGAPTNFMVTPDLPPGLRLRADGRITGTPTEARAPGTYIVTAGNSAGVSTFGVRITVVGRFTVGGFVTGLTGAGLVLNNLGGDELAVSADGAFTFANRIGAGSPFSIGVTTQPSGQTCSVSQGSGNITNVNYAEAQVTCSTNAPKLAGNSLIVECSATLGAAALPYVVHKNGDVTLLGAPAYVFAGDANAAPCSAESVWLDADGRLAYITHDVTHLVSVYATGPDRIHRVIVQ